MNNLNFSYLPAPPVPAAAGLVPLGSWYDIVREAQTTGIEFDDFWLDSVIDSVTDFFAWHDPVRATVLAIWEHGRPRFVECRTLGDRHLYGTDSAAIELEVCRLFAQAGYQALEVMH